MPHLEDIMQMTDPRERVASIIFTAAAFLDGLSHKTIIGCYTPEEADKFARFTFMRATAMLDGDTETAKRVEAEGSALAEQIIARMAGAQEVQ